jgi:hypothetical protein
MISVIYEKSDNSQTLQVRSVQFLSLLMSLWTLVYDSENHLYSFINLSISHNGSWISSYSMSPLAWYIKYSESIIYEQYLYMGIAIGKVWIIGKERYCKTVINDEKVVVGYII